MSEGGCNSTIHKRKRKVAHMTVDGSEQRQVARIAGDTVESRQIIGLLLEVHNHLDGLLQPAGVLLSLGSVAQQVFEYGDVLVYTTPRP